MIIVFTRVQIPNPNCLPKAAMKFACKQTTTTTSGLLWILLTLVTLANGCQQVHFGPRELQNIVCKCDSNYCDHSLEFHWPQDGATIVQVSSNKAGKRFHLDQLKLENQHQFDGKTLDKIVSIDLSKQFQQVAGYGGSITDSAAMLINTKLNRPSSFSGQTLSQLAIKSYFSPNGLNYNMARVPIGGTDMSWRAYSCCDLPEQSPNDDQDFDLKWFSLQDEDFNHKLPLIHEILKLRTNGPNKGDNPLRLIATSWSAPNWMKSHRDLVQGQLRGSIGGQYYDAYARYLIKFIQEYELEINKRLIMENITLLDNVGKRGFKIWAMTPQNEPRTPSRLGRRVVNYNSMNFSPDEMHQYISENLVPNLLNANRSSEEFALFIWDDTLLGLDEYQEQLMFLDDKMTHDYVRGFATHWYSQGLDKLSYSALYELRRTLPNKFAMISTEASYIGRPQPGNWTRAERYARDIIENLRVGSIGWVDWNLALNMFGGPTWSANYLDAAILVDEAAQVFYKNPMFYAIGHLSRFIRAQSHVLQTNVFRPTLDSANLTATSATNCNSFNTNGRTRCKLMDESEEQTSDLLAVASKLDPNDVEQQKDGQVLWSRIGLVLLNRSDKSQLVGLDLRGGFCELRNRAASLQRQEADQQSGAARLIVVELSARSITSLAFNC